jgi:hypothetical protein
MNAERYRVAFSDPRALYAGVEQQPDLWRLWRWRVNTVWREIVAPALWLAVGVTLLLYSIKATFG